jgi:hypothetical protein
VRRSIIVLCRNVSLWHKIDLPLLLVLAKNQTFKAQIYVA